LCTIPCFFSKNTQLNRHKKINLTLVIINEPRRLLVNVMREQIIRGIKDNLQPLIEEGKIILFEENGLSEGSCNSIKEIIDRKGYVFKHFSIKIETSPSFNICEKDISLPTYLKWLPIEGYESYIFKFKQVPLKTKNRYFINIYNLFIPLSLFHFVCDQLPSQCLCPSEFLSPIQTEEWTWWIKFGCKLCGTTYFCECFRTAIEKYKKEALDQIGSYSDSGWPHKFLSAIERTKFRGNICHLCTGVKSDMNYCSPMYGSKVMVNYGAYVKKTSIEESIDLREAENKIRDKLGIPRIGEGWINETQLYKIICYLFPAFSVIREAKTEWLGNQCIDIYMPDLELAIEYQGQQHYKPVEIFGGIKALEKTKEMDERKKYLCKKNGVEIMYFSYDENLTLEFVEKRLGNYLKNSFEHDPNKSK
jgi:hypothetical protein